MTEIPQIVKKLSCGITPVYLRAKGPRYLLLRAYSYWDFPKGMIFRSEDPLQAALRELAEETAIRRETPPYSRNKVARYYIAQVFSLEVELLPNPVLGMPEHHEYRWMPYDSARAHLVERVKPILDWAHRRATHPDD